MLVTCQSENQIIQNIQGSPTKQAQYQVFDVTSDQEINANKLIKKIRISLP